jgi:hypothetical protein
MSLWYHTLARDSGCCFGDQKPNVDEYLNRKAELESKLPEDLRICAARIARAMYTLRNKRNVAHKGQMDPNTIDIHVTPRKLF